MAKAQTNASNLGGYFFVCNRTLRQNLQLLCRVIYVFKKMKGIDPQIFNAF